MATARKKAGPPETPLEAFEGTKQERLQALYNKWYGCTRCNLGELRNCQGSQEIVFGEGNPDAHVLIVGEAPGAEEEATSIPFRGKSGQLLNQILATVSTDPEVIQRYTEYCAVSHGTRNSNKVEEFTDFMVAKRGEEYFITNVVACRPPENIQPVKTQVDACWERLWNIIYIVDPLLIIAAGNSALAAVMRKVSTKITAMRGKIYDVSYDGRVGPVTYPVLPVFHPSYLLRQADWKDKGGAWSKTLEDFRKAARTVDFLRYQYYGTPMPRR